MKLEIFVEYCDTRQLTTIGMKSLFSFALSKGRVKCVMLHAHLKLEHCKLIKYLSKYLLKIIDLAGNKHEWNVCNTLERFTPKQHHKRLKCFVSGGKHCEASTWSLCRKYSAKSLLKRHNRIIKTSPKRFCHEINCSHSGESFRREWRRLSSLLPLIMVSDDAVNN